MDYFYSEDEIDCDIEQLREYLYGFDGAIVEQNGNAYYKKSYVDAFINR